MPIDWATARLPRVASGKRRQHIVGMKLDDFRRMRRIGERKITDESNLRDMSEVHVQQLEQGGARFELDERNGRFRKVERGTIGAWEQLER